MNRSFTGPIGYTTPAEVERLRSGGTAVVQGEPSEFCTVAVRLDDPSVKATCASATARTPTNDQIAAVLLRTGNPTDAQKEQLADYLGRSTHTAAEAGPVGEAVGFQLFLSQLGSWGSILYSKEQAERMLAQDTHVPAMRPLYTHPAEEPGEVAHASAERSAAEVFAPLPGLVKRLARERDRAEAQRLSEAEGWREKLIRTEAALAETRSLIRDAIGLVPLAHQNWHTDARAALTSDAP